MANTAVSVKLSQEEKSRLSSIAERTKRSSHFIMREALMSHMTELEKRLEFIAEAEESWRDYKETGLYYSSEDMLKWASSGGKELPPPRKEPWSK
jgi:predicted transcriptional regulator